jgi:acyl dehydratase
MKFEPRYFEDYRVGESYEALGRTITEADVVLHAGQTGDFYPHHVDAEWTRTQPFGQRIAHGTLIISIAIGMTAGDVNPLAFSYGYDRIRFIKPVFLGDTIHVRSEIADKAVDQKRPGFGFVHEQVTATNQRSETVLVLTHIHLVQMSQTDVKAEPVVESGELRQSLNSEFGLESMK